MGALLTALGRFFLSIAGTVGSMGLLLGQIARRLVRLDLDADETLTNLYKMGVRSLPIVFVTAIFTGGIMVVQAAPTIERYGAHGLLGWGAGFGTLREVGPLLIALMFSGRVGANNTAELGTMVVTSQIDALRALAIDPLSYLVLPRVISMVLMLFTLTVIGDCVAIAGAMVAAKGLLDVEPRTFINSLFLLL